MKRSLLVAFVVASALSLTACGGSTSTPAAETSTETKTVTVQATTIAPAAPVAVASPTTEAPAKATSVVPAEPVVMPAVVCLNLQVAQDLIQEAGVFFSRSKDATGAGRNQVLDSNWSVVAQTPEAGALVTEGEAVLSAVKLGEAGDCS